MYADSDADRRLWFLPVLSLVLMAGCGGHQVIDPGTGPVTQQTPGPVVSQQSGDFTPNPGPIKHVPVSQIVDIPDRSETQQYYQVRQGDTLSGIARAHQIPLSRLLDSNGLDATSTLQPGQSIYLPPAR
ncbi:LysM peptidoglycan-binding domain-containing protein [Symmachiella dynata]|uniref:LysM peptidoglycan-binding domain-containing protein n=1 Tax=Symmachiella dynata TaxID=2527995 RepID=UPI0030EB960A